MNKFFIIMAAIYFLILYITAFIGNRDSRSDDDILWITKHQWRAILTLWLPIFIVLLK